MSNKISQKDEARFATACRKILNYVCDTRGSAEVRNLSNALEIMLLNKEYDGQITRKKPFFERLMRYGMVYRQVETADYIKSLYKCRYTFCDSISENSLTNDWYKSPLTGGGVLTLFAMRSDFIEWIMKDLEIELCRVSDTHCNTYHIKKVNFCILSEIWKVSLHYELTNPESSIQDQEHLLPITDLSTANPRRKALIPVHKEKLGLAKMPTLFQLKHIKATCQYNRSPQ